MQCKPHSYPAYSIRHAYSRYEYVPANILALTYPLRHYQKFATLRFFVRDNAYFESCSKRKRKYCILQGNNTFKFKITLDHHNARQNLHYYVLPDPPLFSLLYTFKGIVQPFELGDETRLIRSTIK
jgi:hypothetical protein